MIRIDDRWSLKHDGHCWHLIEHRPGWTKPKDGGEPEPTTTDHVGYFSRLDQACYRILDSGATAESCTVAHELVAAIEAQGRRIEAAIAGLDRSGTP